MHPSAFCHRDTAYYSLFTVGRPTPDGAQRVAEHADEVLADDAATLARLSALADRYDPAGVLWVGQVIRGFSADPKR